VPRAVDELSSCAESSNRVPVCEMTTRETIALAMCDRNRAAFLQQRKSNIKVNLIGKSDLLCVNP